MGIIPRPLGKDFFGYVGEVTYLRVMIYLKTPTESLSVRQIRKIVRETIVWCEQNVGKRKRKLTYHVHTQKESVVDMFGQYVSDPKKIYIYRNHCKTVKQVICTTLHEYCHHLQDLELYEVILMLFGYDKHPQEIEARSYEKLYSLCWKTIKYKI